MSWWTVPRQVGEIQAALERIERLLHTIHNLETTDMATQAEVIARLKAQETEIASISTVVDSVESLIDVQIQMLADLKAQLAEAIAANDPAALDAVLAQIDANNAALT